MQSTLISEAVRSQKSEVRSLNNKVTSFPSDDFLTRAVLGLQVLAARSHGLNLDHLDHPAMPQAPMKPAA